MKIMTKIKKAFFVLLLTLFVISFFAFNTQEFATTDNYLIGHASYDPLTVIANITLGKQPYCVATNPETNRIYATWSGDNTLHVIDGDTNEILETVSPSSFSQWVMVNPYTNYVYVGDVVLDGETLEEVTSTYQGNLQAVDAVNNLLYTSDYDTLYVLNGTTHGILTSFELEWGFSSYSDAAAVNCDTDKVYLVNNYDSQIPVIVIPEFPSWIPVLLILVVLTVALFVYRRRLFKSQYPNSLSVR